MEWLWAIALKPVFLFALLLMAYPGRLAVRRWMPEGKVKRALLFRVGGPKNPAQPKVIRSAQ